MNNTASFSIPLSLRASGSALKIIAILSMVADHCAYFLMEPDAPFYGVLRSFGRIAFPVFAFLVAEGFAHSRNRMRYFLILAFAGMVSEIPWLMLNGADGTHNVMFTLALGVAALAVFDRLCEHGPLSFVGVSGMAALAWWLGTDYDWRGVLLCFLSPSPARHHAPVAGAFIDAFPLTGRLANPLYLSPHGPLRHSRSGSCLRCHLPI